MKESKVAKLRDQLHLMPSITNFNVGSCSVSPKSILALAHEMRVEMAADPVGFIWHKLPLRIEQSRSHLANFLHVKPSSLLLVENASFAINTLLQGLPLQPGDEVLLTDQEYQHYFPLWRRIEQERGITIHTVTLPKAIHMPDATVKDIVTAFEAAITEKTNYMMFSHVTAPTGLRLPAKTLTQLGHKHDMKVIIDGAHSPGLIPLDVADINPDYYFGNLHKWLMDIPTGGFLYLGDDRKLEPLLTSNYYVYEPSKTDHAVVAGGPTHFSASMEYHGTQDRIAQALLPELFAFRNEFGEEWLLDRMMELSHYAFSALRKNGFAMVSYDSIELATPMVTFKIPRVDVTKTWLWFREKGFEIAIKTLGPDHFVRLSLPAFIEPSDIDSIVNLLVQTPWDEMS